MKVKKISFQEVIKIHIDRWAISVHKVNKAEGQGPIYGSTYSVNTWTKENVFALRWLRHTFYFKI